ncbi:MAG TPA: glycosyltransferase family 2 protein [Caulobacterales bacterium]|nr:glycosyltransferase family 2 protein [Caulobacterales bacterium]
MSATDYPTLARKVRVVILANHEERDLPMCLAGVPKGVGVTLIDSGSTDRTMDIAREHGAQVIEHPFEGFAAQRNFALAEADIKAEWVVFIDADEVFQKSFWDWAEKTLAAGDPPLDAVYVTSKLVLDGVVLEHAPAYPIYHSRFVRHGRAIFVDGDTSHNETILRDLRTGKVDAPYLHYFQSGPLLPWMKKHLGLADEEVHEGEPTSGIRTGRALLNRAVGNGPLKALLRFFYHYFFCLGFLDGKAGLRYSAMYSWYEFSKWVMSLEDPTQPNVAWVKRLEAQANRAKAGGESQARPAARVLNG